jgi:hypothetical protein
MEIERLLNTIQESCNVFIEQKINDVLTQLKQNKTVLDSNFPNIQIQNIDKKSWGVYAFYMRPKKMISTYEELNGLWQTGLDDKPLQSPRVIKGNFKPLNIGESTCLYVGKSEDLISRISQHIYQRTKPSTYGLKLSDHNRLHIDNTFEYSYFVLKVNPSKQTNDAMKCLLVTLEKRLRSRLKPLIGKQ